MAAGFLIFFSEAQAPGGVLEFSRLMPGSGRPLAGGHILQRGMRLTSFVHPASPSGIGWAGRSSVGTGELWWPFYVGWKWSQGD